MWDVNVTPWNILPVWHFLVFYAVLKVVPHRILGAGVLVALLSFGIFMGVTCGARILGSLVSWSGKAVGIILGVVWFVWMGGQFSRASSSLHSRGLLLLLVVCRSVIESCQGLMHRGSFLWGSVVMHSSRGRRVLFILVAWLGSNIIGRGGVCRGMLTMGIFMGHSRGVMLCNMVVWGGFMYSIRGSRLISGLILHRWDIHSSCERRGLAVGLCDVCGCGMLCLVLLVGFRCGMHYIDMVGGSYLY